MKQFFHKIKKLNNSLTKNNKYLNFNSNLDNYRNIHNPYFSKIITINGELNSVISSSILPKLLKEPPSQFRIITEETYYSIKQDLLHLSTNLKEIDQVERPFLKDLNEKILIDFEFVRIFPNINCLKSIDKIYEYNSLILNEGNDYNFDENNNNLKDLLYNEKSNVSSIYSSFFAQKTFHLLNSKKNKEGNVIFFQPGIKNLENISLLNRCLNFSYDKQYFSNIKTFYFNEQEKLFKSDKFEKNILNLFSNNNIHFKNNIKLIDINENEILFKENDKEFSIEYNALILIPSLKKIELNSDFLDLSNFNKKYLNFNDYKNVYGIFNVHEKMPITIESVIEITKIIGHNIYERQVAEIEKRNSNLKEYNEVSKVPIFKGKREIIYYDYNLKENKEEIINSSLPNYFYNVYLYPWLLRRYLKKLICYDPSILFKKH